MSDQDNGTVRKLNARKCQRTARIGGRVNLHRVRHAKTVLRRGDVSPRPPPAAM